MAVNRKDNHPPRALIGYYSEETDTPLSKLKTIQEIVWESAAEDWQKVLIQKCAFATNNRLLVVIW